MKLRQLEVFGAIYLAGSITSAAKNLHVSAPAVSRMLGLLEHQLGYTLFSRHPSGLTPTFEAQQLFRSVKPLFTQFSQVLALGESLRCCAGRNLRIGSSSSAALRLVPDAIALLNKNNGELNISLDVLHTDDLIDQLLSFDIDVGISTVTVSHPDLVVEMLYETQLVCAFKKGHDLGKFNSISLAQVGHYPIINFHSDAPQVARINEAFIKTAQRPNKSVTARFSSTALSLVIATNHVALVDEVAARDFGHKDIEYRPINDYQTFQVTLISLAQNPNANLVALFRNAITKALTKH
jgi:DNA-binding transcriptional LysR family regulator